MNKAQLVERIAEYIDCPKNQSEALLDATLEVIQEALSRGEEVKLVGFGTFSLAERKERQGRNPKTGQTLKIPSSKIPKFKAGKDFKERVN